MTDHKDLLRTLRAYQKAVPRIKEEPDHAIGGLVSRNKRRSGRKKAQKK